jgi:hypothetical protein
MKSFLRFSFLLIGCFIFSAAKSQTDWSEKFSWMVPQTPGNCEAGLLVRNDFWPSHTSKSYTIGVAYPINSHWYLNYNYRFVQTDQGLHFAHFPFAAMLLRFIPQMKFHHGDGNALVSLLAISATLPEGVSYKINPQDKFRFTVYANPFGFDREIFMDENEVVKKPWTYAMNAGVQIQSDWGKRFYVSSDTGVTWMPDGGRTALSFGIGIGMKFPEADIF